MLRLRCLSIVATAFVFLGMPESAGAQTPTSRPLKAESPTLVEPAHGIRTDTLTPRLTVRNGAATFVRYVFDQRFEIIDVTRDPIVIATVLVPPGEETTSYTVPLPLHHDTTYRWRARAELGDAVGPWSEERTFVTPLPPPKPRRALTFTDITLASGVGIIPDAGHGVFFADANGSGRPDLYVTRIAAVVRPIRDDFFVNQGSARFVDEATVRGIDDLDLGSHGAAWADLDNDGDFDFVNGGTDQANNVYRNTGTGFFVDVTPPAMLQRQEGTRAVVAFDMEGDGDLDLFMVSGWQGQDDPPGERNEVYRNDGAARFTEIRSGAAYTALAGQGATDTDYDGDGDIDLIAANGGGNLQILRNDGRGTFTTVDPNTVGITHHAYGGVTMGDIDNDGDLDLVMVSLTAPPSDRTSGHLYRNVGAGRFRFVRSFDDIDGYMGGFADLDLDGDIDLVFAGHHTTFLNDGTGTFAPGPPVPVQGIRDPRSIAFADVDDDGDLDFSVAAKGSREWLVRNNIDSGNWLKVRLRSPQGQAGAFGAKVTIYPGSIGMRPIGFREARSSNGYLGQDDPVLHFGLGEHESVTVIVIFLDKTVKAITGVAANSTLSVSGSAITIEAHRR